MNIEKHNIIILVRIATARSLWIWDSKTCYRGDCYKSRYTWYTQVLLLYASNSTNTRPSHCCRIEPHTQAELCLRGVIIQLPDCFMLNTECRRITPRLFTPFLVKIKDKLVHLDSSRSLLIKNEIVTDFKSGYTLVAFPRIVSSLRITQ